MKTVFENHDLLDLMLNDMSQADPLYAPTSFWEAASDKLIEEINVQGVETFKSQPMPLTFFVPTYGFPGFNRDPDLYAPVQDALETCSQNPKRLKLRQNEMMSGVQQAMADYRVFLASCKNIPPYLETASESQVGAPLEQFIFDGRRYSRTFLNYMLGLNFIKQNCDTSNIVRVAEIGGGHGGLGELLLADERHRYFYLDIDIPPISFVATWYLEQILGVDRVYSYRDSSKISSLQIDSIASRYDAAVICPWQLPQLTGNIDLFVNYVSFQEMEPKVVRNYLAHIERLTPRLILLRNMREGKQIAKGPGEIGVTEPILADDYDDYLPAYRLIATNVLPFGHLTEDGFHSELRLYEKK